MISIKSKSLLVNKASDIHPANVIIFFSVAEDVQSVNSRNACNHNEDGDGDEDDDNDDDDDYHYPCFLANKIICFYKSENRLE